ncbi:uncharacterized protein LOC143374836 isoform X2 [Andrena cerasifolii]|uniref:uncharacterized protein LOC143374836 isoform X2 n=1 Tax=Andrena cerasifolii TaxID=2819439 RepID=UPI004037E723
MWIRDALGLSVVPGATYFPLGDEQQSNSKGVAASRGTRHRGVGSRGSEGSPGRRWLCDSITGGNKERILGQALSLLCIKKFSGSGTMLEAPPGSREDLVEAARTPCTPTDLDTMLYGYTNNIYVLDHTPESLPDIDMLQLFASPAGRALLTSDNRPRGSTSTSSLSRESSSRLKSGRRPSGTGTVSAPTSPPRQRKSSTELYKEAVEILGLTCSLTDSCRCIDCQSNYFDCDDDCGDARTELAAGTPILLDHALSHPLTCSIQ